MPRQIVFTPNAAKPPASYSQAVKAAWLLAVNALRLGLGAAA